LTTTTATTTVHNPPAFFAGYGIAKGFAKGFELSA
jgi:hypothetical protein